MGTLNPVLKVLKFVAENLNEKGILWVLAGSTASYLNGLDVKPRDLDILTDKENAYKIDGIFTEKFEVLRRMSYGETEIYASYFGRYRFQSVFVEVIGDLKIKYGNEEFFVPLKMLLKYSKKIKLNNTLIKVVPLEIQLIYNLMIPGKEERARKIALCLNSSKDIDYDALKTFLNFVSKEIRDKIFNLVKIR